MSENRDTIDRSLRVFPLAIPAELTLEGWDPIEGHIVNLSQTGVFFSASDTAFEACELGDSGRLCFTVPGEMAKVDLEVRFRWGRMDQDEDGAQIAGCGLEFEALSSEAESIIRQYVAWFERMREKLDALDEAKSNESS